MVPTYYAKLLHFTIRLDVFSRLMFLICKWVTFLCKNVYFENVYTLITVDGLCI